MARMLLCVLLCATLALGVLGDMYLQSPRGSNDRLMEESDRQNAQRLFDSENNARGGYCWGPAMSYVEGSYLPIEWTAQHGCGGTHVTCTEIVQYMCTDTTGPQTNILRDGTDLTTIPDDPNAYNQKNADGSFQYGMMENYTYYQDCKARERNMGLFVADQNPYGRAVSTRQNPGGTRYGFECTEERDYYPYWHPSPWKDIAVFTDKIEHCAFYQKESQNVKAKNYCQMPSGTAATTTVPNYEAACVKAGGTWATQPSFGLPPPECSLAVFSRDNHLGNAFGAAETANFTWTVPVAKVESCIDTSSCQCAIRIRYNITTNESSGVTDNFIDVHNNSIIHNNPTFNVEGGQLTLALNTAQYGRTFQDRSFMFHIIPRPSGVSDSTKIYNLNVRGKRGNIVQTFPATEYDFVPGRLEVQQDDIIHFQWTGCDHNPGNNQGEGLVKTDRSNIVQIKNLDSNIPVVATNDTVQQTLFESSFLRNRMALLGQTGCVVTNNDQDPNNCAKLNAAPPYFDGGLVRMNQTGEYYYMNTRNNNFSNRTQKGRLVVTPRDKAASVALIVGLVFGALAVIGVAMGGAIYYGKKNPHTVVGRVVDKLPHIPIERYLPSKAGGDAAASRRAPLLMPDN